uniref:Uncharacterized protein n=1 Tax=mine drainage metagenome TaxID=410659 RepID=E6QFJ5_9ZZZZ
MCGNVWCVSRSCQLGGVIRSTFAGMHTRKHHPDNNQRGDGNASHYNDFLAVFAETPTAFDLSFDIDSRFAIAQLAGTVNGTAELRINGWGRLSGSCLERIRLIRLRIGPRRVVKIKHVFLLYAARAYQKLGWLPAWMVTTCL